METMFNIESIELWLKLSVPILGLIGGTGWIKYYHEWRNRKKDRDRERLTKTLVVLALIHRRFVQTFNISQEIMYELNIPYLEYPPGDLLSIIAKSRSLYTVDEFQKRFERIHNINLEAKKIYMDFQGTLNRELHNGLNEFVKHADKWFDCSKDLKNEKVRVDERGLIEANPFPKEVVITLEKEMFRIEKEIEKLDKFI